MRTPTSAENQERINAMLETLATPICNLRDRWQDEKDYEDFSEYAAVMRSTLPAGFTLVAASKSPFGFTFRLDDLPEAVYRIKATARAVGWSRVL